MLFSRSLADNDLWGYLSFGSVFWEDGYFPFQDIFSYPPTKPVWVYHEWLTGVFFYFIYKYSGSPGLQLLHCVIAVTIYLGCKSIRHSVLFGLVFGSHLPVVLSEYWEAWRAKRIFFTLPLWVPQSMPVALLLFLYVLINPSLSLTAVPSVALRTPSPHFPVGAINWIKENRVQGNILPHFDWGEFLIWTCYPPCRVAMDGRYETVYEEEVYKEYFDFLNGRDKWDIFLRKYPHDIVLIKRNTRTHLLMLREPSWRVAYADQGCVLFLNKKLGDFGGS